MWGDASLWYLIAEANGLSGASQLAEGMTLSIPNKVANFHNTTDTFQPYDASKALGNVMPSLVPKPPPPKGKCGIAQVVVAIVAIAVFFITKDFYSSLKVFQALGATATVAAAGATASVASQLTAMRLGIQDKFSWKDVALSALSAGVSEKLSSVKALKFLQNAPDAAVDAVSIAKDFARGALSSAVTQGIAKPLGLIDKFSWTDVAVAGVSASVQGAVSRSIEGRSWAKRNDLGEITEQVDATRPNLAISGMAGAISGAAARSMMNGGDFGDNLLAVLPTVIANTVGMMIEDGLEKKRNSHFPKDGEDPIGDLIQESLQAYGDGTAQARIFGGQLEQIAYRPGETTEQLDGFSLRYGDDDRAQMMKNAVAEINAAQSAMVGATGEDAAILQDALQSAMVRYELAAARPGALRASGLVGGGFLLEVAEAYRRGADDLAADIQRDPFFEGADIGQVLNGFRNGAVGDVFGAYLDNTITISSLDDLSPSLVAPSMRSNIVRSLGSARGELKRLVEGGLYGGTTPGMLAMSPFAGLDRGFSRSATNGLSSSDIRSINAGLKEAAGRSTYTDLLSLATGTVAFGALSRSLKSSMRLTADMLDGKGHFLGMRNAGQNSPRFKAWLAKPGHAVEILPNGAVRYTKPIDGKPVSVIYRDGLPEFSPYAHKGLKSGLSIPVRQGRGRARRSESQINKRHLAA